MSGGGFVLASRFSRRGLEADAVARILRRVSRSAGLDAVRIEVAFLNDEKMAALNQTYRGKSGATDVLSFGHDDDEDVFGFSPPAAASADATPWASEMAAMAYSLGDLAIGRDVARRQAAAAGHDVATEVAVLAVHGALHLLGHDHETGERDALAFCERELGLLAAARISPRAALAGRAHYFSTSVHDPAI